MCVGQSEDVLSLQLHPLQHALDRGERLRFLHRAFVTVVNEVPPRAPPWGQRSPRAQPGSATGPPADQYGGLAGPVGACA